MSWSPSLVIPTSTRRPGWFPALPTPTPRTPAVGWWPVFAATLAAQLQAAAAVLAGGQAQSGTLAAQLHAAATALAGVIVAWIQAEVLTDEEYAEKGYVEV